MPQRSKKSILQHGAFVLFLALMLACISGRRKVTPPYPPSSVISEVSFDFSTHEERAPGSDNWPVTWADDGHQYTSWGDGGGFGGTNSNGRVSLGFGRVEGNWDTFEGFNVWGGINPENPDQFDGKSYGIISIEGVLYAWWGPGSNTTSYDETRLLISTDKAATWTESAWDFTDVDDELIMPTILNFGKDYAGARDTYVYHYFIRREPTGSGLGIHRGGSPATGKIERDLEQTKYSIDLLQILRDKMRGTLTDEEEKLINTALYDLRMRYVEACR